MVTDRQPGTAAPPAPVGGAARAAAGAHDVDVGVVAAHDDGGADRGVDQAVGDPGGVQGGPHRAGQHGGGVVVGGSVGGRGREPAHLGVEAEPAGRQVEGLEVARSRSVAGTRERGSVVRRRTVVPIARNSVPTASAASWWRWVALWRNRSRGCRRLGSVGRCGDAGGRARACW